MNVDDCVIGAENLTMRYGRKTACANVSFEVRLGSVYALLGRNGAGKSSLICSLLGLQKPQAGAAFLFGLPVWQNRVRALQRVGVVPEEPDAPPEMTVRQIAAFSSRLYPAWNWHRDIFTRAPVISGYRQSHLFRSPASALIEYDPLKGTVRTLIASAK